MEVYPQVSLLSMKLNRSIESKKFLMMAQCVILCGVTQMRSQDGWSVQEALDTFSEARSSRNSIEKIELI